MSKTHKAESAFTAIHGLLSFSLIFLAIWAAIPSGGYIWTATTTKGVSFIAVVGTVGLTSMLFIGLFLLYRFGHKVLPFLPYGARQRVVPIFASGLLVISAISMGTSTSFVAEAPAMQAQMAETVDEAGMSVNRVIAAQSFGESAAILLETKKAQLVSAAESERASGAFCGSNRGGAGQCVQVLQSLVVSVNTAQTALTNAKSRSGPLIERLRAAQETARRAFENDRLSYTEKKQIIDEQLALMVTLMRQLQGNIPVQAIEAASQSLSQEWSALGLPAVGAARLSNLLDETAATLRLMLDDLKEVRAEIPALDQKNSFEVIADQFDKVWPLVLLAACPDGLSLIMLAIFFLAFRIEDDAEADEDANSGGGLSNISSLPPTRRPNRPHRSTRPHTYH